MVLRRVLTPTLSIIRLTVTAVAAFVVAQLVTGRSSVLAPLTALLVVQVTLFKTLRSALQRVLSVVAGVVVALVLSTVLGFTWWSLGITIAASLMIGYALRLGENAMEVPISAMLILTLPVEHAASDRILSTLLGAATGLIVNLLVAPLQVQPAEEAVEDLSQQLADLLDRMSADLAEGRGAESSDGWTVRARDLRADLERVERTLGQAEESVRLNPRTPLVTDPRVHLRRRLQALEVATLTTRGIARSLHDSSRTAVAANPVSDVDASHRVSEVLRDLAAALRSYGQLAQSAANRDELKANVDRSLASASEHQGAAADVLRADQDRAEGWPLRGELLTHLDRLRGQLGPPPPAPQRRVGAPQRETLRHPLRSMARLYRHVRKR